MLYRVHFRQIKNCANTGQNLNQTDELFLMQVWNDPDFFEGVRI